MGFFRGLPLPLRAGASALEYLPTGDSELPDMLVISSIGVGGTLSDLNSTSMLSLLPEPSSVPEVTASSDSPKDDRDSDDALEASGMCSIEVLISRGNLSDLMTGKARVLGEGL